MQLLKRVVAANPLGEPYRLVPFDQSRLPSLLATYRAAWPEEDVDAAQTRRSLLGSDGLVLAEAGVAVVGYAMWEIVYNLVRVGGAPLGLIHEVAVHPDHRRRGIGSALTAFAVSQLRQVPHIELLVVGENPAQAMYAALGFEVVEDVVFMARDDRSGSPHRRPAVPRGRRRRTSVAASRRSKRLGG